MRTTLSPSPCLPPPVDDKPKIEPDIVSHHETERSSPEIKCKPKWTENTQHEACKRERWWRRKSK
jgi:hypothetical protein